LDVAVLDGIRDRLGDFAAAFLAAAQWGAAVAQLLGSGTAECWTGTYAAHSIAAERGPLRIRLSGGDLDEALAGVLTSGGGTGSGTVFDRVGAFRRGFQSGPDGCSGSG